MTVHGMDIEDVRALATQAGAAADRLDGVATQLQAALTRASWQGPDAGAFRSDWNGRHRTALTGTATSLREVQRILDRQVQQQQTASAADGGATTSAGGGGTKAVGGGTKTNVGGNNFIADAINLAQDFIANPQDTIGNVIDDAMKDQDIADFFGDVLSFEYVEDGDFYTTNQDGFQSHAGFMDFFDLFGPALGMDLHESVTEFTHDGVSYRLELWRGSYAMEGAYGGEIGLYTRDASLPGFFDWHPAATDDQRIHMIQELYNSETGETYLVSDGHETIGEDQFWNLAIQTTDGVDIDTLGQRGQLGVTDPELRDVMLAELQADGINAYINDNGYIEYTWE